MGFGTGKFAKVWKVENKGKYSVAEMSTSKKNKETDKYETDWSNKFVRLVGTANDQAKLFKDGESVKIGNCEVTNKYDKDKKITYTNYVIFNFEGIETKGSNNKSQNSTNTGFTPTTNYEEDDDLPF